MSKPGFELQWTTNPGNRPRGLNGLTQGVSANGVTLFVPMSVVAGSSNNVYGIDNDTGYIVWSRKFDATLPAADHQVSGRNHRRAGAHREPDTGRRGRAAGLRRRSRRRTGISQPARRAGRRRAGRGAWRPCGGCAAGSGHSAPGRCAAGGWRSPPAAPRCGAPPAAGAPPPAGTPPAAGAPPRPVPVQGAARVRPGTAGWWGWSVVAAVVRSRPVFLVRRRSRAAGSGRPSGVAYAISSDGMLHVLGLPSGKDIQRPAEFLPANAKWSDAVAVNTTLYAATSSGCGTAPNAVWAIDLGERHQAGRVVEERRRRRRRPHRAHAGRHDHRRHRTGHGHRRRQSQRDRRARRQDTADQGLVHEPLSRVRDGADDSASQRQGHRDCGDEGRTRDAVRRRVTRWRGPRHAADRVAVGPGRRHHHRGRCAGRLAADAGDGGRRPIHVVGAGAGLRVTGLRHADQQRQDDRGRGGAQVGRRRDANARNGPGSPAICRRPPRP